MMQRIGLYIATLATLGWAGVVAFGMNTDAKWTSALILGGLVVGGIPTVIYFTKQETGGGR